MVRPLFDRRPEWAALAVGWAQDAAPMLFRGITQGRANGQMDAEMRSRYCWLRTRLPVGSGYAAAFFTDFDADLGEGFFVALAFSFAANSCLTVAEMASTSTL